MERQTPMKCVLLTFQKVVPPWSTKLQWKCCLCDSAVVTEMGVVAMVSTHCGDFGMQWLSKPCALTEVHRPIQLGFNHLITGSRRWEASMFAPVLLFYLKRSTIRASRSFIHIIMMCISSWTHFQVFKSDDWNVPWTLCEPCHDHMLHYPIAGPLV